MEPIEQAVAVGFVLVLLCGTLWWLRRRGLAGVPLVKRRSGRALEHLDRLALGPQQVLHLVRLCDHALLLASSPAGCVLVERVPLPDVGRPDIQAGVGR